MKSEDALRLVVAAIIVVLLVLVLTGQAIVTAKLLLLGAAIAFALAAVGIPSGIGLVPLGLFLWVVAVLIGK